MKLIRKHTFVRFLQSMIPFFRPINSISIHAHSTLYYLKSRWYLFVCLIAISHLNLNVYDVKCMKTDRKNPNSVSIVPAIVHRLGGVFDLKDSPIRWESRHRQIILSPQSLNHHNLQAKKKQNTTSSTHRHFSNNDCKTLTHPCSNAAHGFLLHSRSPFNKKTK